MTKALAKIGAALGIAGRAKTAESAADHAALIEQVQAAVAAADKRLTTLEVRRSAVILEGQDVAEYHRELHQAREEVLTLKASLAEAERRHREAVAREARDKLESECGLTRDIAGQGYAQGLRDMHAALDAFRRAAA